MKRFLKIIFYGIILFFISGIAFFYLSPQFGTNPTKEQKKFYSKFSNYENNEFQNLEEFKVMSEKMSFFEWFKDRPNRIPKKELHHESLDLDSFTIGSENKIKLSWLGHSAFILNINGYIILLDPMLGKYAAPVPLPSLKRYSSEIAFSIDDLESVDAVIISHDHYDHLDYSTIKKIKNRVNKFYVPHGLGNHLKGWGVNDESIIELNWNESASLNDIQIVCLPAQHFSGRGPLNRYSTLWCSWAIKSKFGKIYFSGDSGYGKHLKSIGKEHGPFDISFIDCGQYNRAWKNVHMFPEEAVKASRDLLSSYFMPIHWGGFTLSLHSWDEPVKRALSSAIESNQKIITPKLGQTIIIDESLANNSVGWWSSY